MAVRIHDPVEKRCDLALNHLDLLFHISAGFGLTAVALLPFLPQLRFQPLHAFRRRRDRLQQVSKAVIYLAPSDRLAPHLTATVTTDIIGIVAIPSLRPIGCHGMIAAAAVDETAQREILTDIDPRRRIGLASQFGLIAFEGFQRDEPLVMGFTQAEPEGFALQVSGIDRTGQDTVRLLVGDCAIFGFRKIGMRFQKPLHFGLGIETAVSKAVQGFGDDGGQRLIRNKDAATTYPINIIIAEGRCVDVKTAHHTSAHAVMSLFAVFLALVLCGTGQHMLNEQCVGIFTKFDRRGFQRSACIGDGLLQHEMCPNITSHAADIVDDDHQPLFAVSADEFDHRLKPWARCNTARHVIGEDRNHLMPAIACIFTAASFL